MKLYYKEDYCTLIQGDCIEVMNKMVDKNLKFDAIITDLPYGTTACKWDNIIPFEEMWKYSNLLLKENSVFITTANQPFTSKLILSNVGQYRYSMVWIKNKGTDIFNANRKPLNAHEDIVVFAKGKPTYNSQRREGEPYIRKQGKKSNITGQNLKGITTINNGGRNPLSWILIPNITGKDIHPTQKPIELYEYLIKTYTNENDIILDLTCGSGTTLVASKKLNRKCYGIELDEKYCEITKNRLIKTQ